MNGAGMRFPITAIENDCQNGRPSTQPRGMAPRSSMIGIIEQKNTASCGGNVSVKNVLIASIKVTPHDRSIYRARLAERYFGRLEQQAGNGGIYAEFHQVKSYDIGEQINDSRDRYGVLQRRYQKIERDHYRSC